MVISNRRRWSRLTAALVVLAMLPCSGSRVLAAQSRSAEDIASCRTIVSDFVARAPVMRRTNDRVARLLNERHYHQAASALRSAVSSHPDGWAGYTLGTLYAAGLGVPRSPTKAFRWYLWSAERSYGLAQRRVANAYLDGIGTRRNAVAAAYWFRIGIAAGQLARVDYELGQTYAAGHLAPVDRSKAGYYRDRSLSELRELTEEPNGEAAYYLGLAYEYGRGVPKNRAQGLRYLCRAASLRYAPAVSAIRHLLKPLQ